MNDDVFISIIMPVFNAESYIQRTLQCLDAQVFKEYELILIDDCSADNTLDAILRWQKKDNRIILVKNEKNNGAGKSRNEGLKYAKGEYVIFLDADDYFFSYMLTELAHSAKKFNPDLIIFNTLIEADERLIDCSINGKRYMEFVDREFVLRGKEPINVPWNKLVRRELIIEKKILFQELPSANDVYYSYEVVRNSESIIYLNYPLLVYNTNQNGSITTKNKSKLYFLNAYEKVIDSYKNENEGIKSALANVISASIFQYGCLLNEDNISNYIVHIRNCECYKKLLISDCAPEIFTRYMKCILKKEINYNENPFIHFAVKRLETIVKESTSSNKKICLWGYGQIGKRLLECMEKRNIKINYLVDNNDALWHSRHFGYTIFKYEEIKDAVNVVIISTHKFIDSILKCNDFAEKEIVDLLWI